MHRTCTSSSLSLICPHSMAHALESKTECSRIITYSHMYATRVVLMHLCNSMVQIGQFGCIHSQVCIYLLRQRMWRLSIYTKEATEEKRYIFCVSSKTVFSGKSVFVVCTCQLTRLERFSTISRCSVLVGGPYLIGDTLHNHISHTPHYCGTREPTYFPSHTGSRLQGEENA